MTTISTQPTTHLVIATGYSHPTRTVYQRLAVEYKSAGILSTTAKPYKPKEKLRHCTHFP